MGFFKKIRHKVSRTLRRLRKGKIHLTHSLMSSTGNKKLLPARARHFASRLRFGYIKSHLRKRLGGNNSAFSVSYSGDAPQNGYTYSGRSISELM